ncbi:choice-of-anchor J domain-containing protein [Kaistella sp. BT6-1-3]|uniref:Choice-of-anchor J domain-containing protein n=1 Tax=Kaistella yananensis TaxID=2989820 RepID=A0ABT3JMY0_9FLAO|nr:choice-of-anchor J domain-containing protein [Kaistella yananensis]MCW4452130.1 choice-of-anchor J domain-containing protein [Kaistella yananensis]
MKKILLFASFLAIPFSGTAQVFQENFDGAGPGFGAWTLIDVDGQSHAEAVSDFDAGAWIRKNRGGPTPNYGGPDNDFAAASSSWYDPAGTSNDWLVSPQIVLPAGNTFLQWDSKAQDPAYPDGYKVMLAPNGGNTVSDFTITLFDTAAENPAWTTRTANLSAYSGTTVRVAFVNNSNDKFVLLVDNISVQLAPTSPPDCPTLVSPANAAAGIDYTAPVTLTWTAATSGTAATSYDVYLGTSPNPTTLLGNVPGTTTSATGLAPSTTYYWRVISKNGAGDATGCTEFSFTTAANPFAPYCGPVSITSNTEPITLVNFAGINNETSPTLNGTPDHENFTTIVGNVTQGSSYDITLKGNTGGNWVNRFAVFIDWNQNGILNDAGEVYQITQTITNSTGTDNVQAVQSLAVPSDAVLGNTRMRVKKIFGTTNYLDPCANASFGQLEDYTLNVTSLGVNDNMKNAVKIYPNPVVEMLNIESPNKVKSVSVFDATGKVVSTYSLNASKSQINLSKLAPGVYVVNIEMENETKSIKVIKK